MWQELRRGATPDAPTLEGPVFVVKLVGQLGTVDNGDRMRDAGELGVDRGELLSLGLRPIAVVVGDYLPLRYVRTRRRYTVRDIGTLERIGLHAGEDLGGDHAHAVVKVRRLRAHKLCRRNCLMPAAFTASRTLLWWRFGRRQPTMTTPGMLTTPRESLLSHALQCNPKAVRYEGRQ